MTIPARQAPAKLILQYDPAFVRQYRNLEDAYTYGVDVTLKWNITREIAVGGGYSFLQARGRVYDEETEQLRELTIDGTAHHKGNFFATWRHLFKNVYRLGIGLYGRASSTRYYENFGNGKAYHLWRLNTTHDFEGHKLRRRGLTLRAELGVDNIFNYVDRTPHLRHLGTTTPGTTIYAAVVIRFNKGTKIKDNSKHSTLKTNYNNEED